MTTEGHVMAERKLVGGRLLACLISAAIVAFAVPAGAGAATTVGSTFAPSGFSCQDNFWALQTTSPSNQYVVPSDGVLTSFSHEASATNAPSGLKLEVGRATATANQFFIVGVSPIMIPAASSLNQAVITIPVQEGDLVGLRSTGTNRNCGETVSGYGINYLGTDPLAGDTVSGTFTNASFRLDVSASLEADCDGDDQGDETQDGDRHTCRPVLDSIGPKSVIEGQTLSFMVTGADPNLGDTLTYEASSLPPGADFDPSTQTFSWTPTAGQAGSYPGVRFTVTDDSTPALSDSEDVTIAVSAPPSTTPPTISGPTGQRAAALKKCKKKKSATARKKCKKKAKLLPV
jgi:hypothetical protein